MGRNDRGKGRGGGGGRGSGKKMFIANEDELAIREREISEQREQRARRRGEDDEDEDGEGDSSSSDEKETAVPQPKAAVVAESDAPAGQESVFAFERKSRAEVEADRAAAKAAKASKKAAATAAAEEEDDAPAAILAGGSSNPNRQPHASEDNLNRKEREALAAQKAKEDYMRRHLAGETEQARKDMERLALIRKRREEAAKKREAEGRAPGWSANGIDSDDSGDDSDAPPRAKAASAVAAPAPAPAPVSAAAAKKKAAAAAVDEVAEAAADGGPAKLKAMDIKTMNGDALKDHLKARNLPIQGQKKDLIKRLMDYEAARP